MKFAVAAEILAQKIPDIASEEQLVVSPPSISEKEERALFQQADLVNRFKTFEGAQGLLKNSSGPKGLMKTCDPLSEDLDIGVLSCGSGYECVEDEASVLGGFCLQTSRELQEPTVYCDMCGYGKGVNLDIAPFQPVILLTGDLATCEDIRWAAYVDPVLTATTCPVYRSLAIAAGCCFPYECPRICEDKKFLPYNLVSAGDGAAYCLGLVSQFDAAECITYADDVTKSCCEASDAVWMWSTRTAVSMVGFATTITAAVMAIT